mmetsp:Transcript_42299/g.73568  ORF Transcript_42299/g.73568 Transcript_42299/m.73568 type:complete len:262 (+) Transcript_42299:963-1748(+)
MCGMTSSSLPASLSSELELKKLSLTFSALDRSSLGREAPLRLCLCTPRSAGDGLVVCVCSVVACDCDGACDWLLAPVRAFFSIAAPVGLLSGDKRASGNFLRCTCCGLSGAAELARGRTGLNSKSILGRDGKLVLESLFLVGVEGVSRNVSTVPAGTGSTAHSSGTSSSTTMSSGLKYGAFELFGPIYSVDLVRSAACSVPKKSCFCTYSNALWSRLPLRSFWNHASSVMSAQGGWNGIVSTISEALSGPSGPDSSASVAL